MTDKVERMLGKCRANIERSVQTASPLYDTFENKGNVFTLNETKIDSTRFQQAFNIFTLSTMGFSDGSYLQTVLAFLINQCVLQIQLNVKISDVFQQKKVVIKTL